MLDITYPQILFKFLPLWRKLFCPRGWHLWDEVLTLEGTWNTYLHCDACELQVKIDNTKSKNT